jgi:hypothetical protein
VIGFAARLGLVIGIIAGQALVLLYLDGVVSALVQSILLVLSLSGFTVYVINPGGNDFCAVLCDGGDEK